MIKIGITGEMGSGKTYVCNLFSSLGVTIYNCDSESKRVVNSNKKLMLEIKSEFGDVYTNDILDTIKMRSIVFSKDSEQKLKRLNQICHPYVFEDFLKFCDDNKKLKVILAESAILYECEMDKILDKVIYVSAPEDVRIERVFKRNKLTKEEYQYRMRNQISHEKKIVMADYLIHNPDSHESNVKSQVINIYNTIISC